MQLSPTKSRYSAFDRELLAIYLTIKHFRYIIEAQEFTIYADLKPLTFTFRQKLDKATPRQSRHLDFIIHEHVLGQDNVVADALSRVDAASARLDCDAQWFEKGQKTAKFGFKRILMQIKSSKRHLIPFNKYYKFPFPRHCSYQY